MSKFRKKPVVIEARQLNGEECWNQWSRKIAFWPGSMLHISGSWHEGDHKIYDAYIQIDTLEGVMRASLGDWVIKGVKGEFYPCRNDIFETTYESVAE